MHGSFAVILLAWVALTVGVFSLAEKMSVQDEVRQLLLQALKDIAQAGLAATLCLWIIAAIAIKHACAPSPAS